MIGVRTTMRIVPRFAAQGAPHPAHQAEHIARSEEERGVDPDEAKNIGFATVSKQKGRGG